MSIAPLSTQTTLSAGQIADYARLAGFQGEGLRIAVAVAMGESGGRTNAVGDVTIQDAKWGPSIGLWQIRSIKAEKGKGSNRDELANYDPLHNAKAAYQISGGGANFKPWSVYTNGAYKKFLDGAGTAATSSESRGGSAGSSTRFAGDVNYPVPPPSALSIEPGEPIDPSQLTILGHRIAEITGGYTSASIDMSSNQISQLTITYCDPELKIWNASARGLGTEAQLGDWKLDIAGASSPGYQNGVWYTTLTFWLRGLYRLRKERGQTRNEMSAGEWIAAEANRFGIKVVNFEAKGVKRQTIGPDMDESSVSLDGSTPKVKDPETIWATMSRLAKEDGCWLFSWPEYLVYGKPTILARALPFLDCGFNGSVNSDRSLDWINLAPDLSADVNSAAVPSKVARVTLPRWRGERCRPGMALRFPGMKSFEEGNYIASSVRWEISADYDDVEVSIEVPVDPEPQLEDDSGLGNPIVAQAGDPATDGVVKGTKSANDFVAFAQKQVGDDYVYGATPRATDSNPNAFDCSSLVQWAAAQVGLSMPRSSNAQLAACQRLTVEEASKIRGALIFKAGDGANGHVVISLGDGEHTIEARGQRYGVVSYRISGNRGFTDGGLIPGMNYGPRTSNLQSSVFDAQPLQLHSSQGSW